MIVDEEAPPSYQEAVLDARGLHDRQPHGSSSRIRSQPLPSIQTTSSHATTPTDWSPVSSDRTLSHLSELDSATRVQERRARSPGKPVVPPSSAPPSTARSSQTYSPSEPHSSPKGRFTGNGFKPRYRGVVVDHDVSPSDWARFLEDLEVGGRATGAQRIMSEIPPTTMHMSIKGLLLMKAIKASAKKMDPQVQETLEVWCQEIFRSRRRRHVSKLSFIHSVLERLTARHPGESIPSLQQHDALSRPSSPSSPSSSELSSASSHNFHAHLSLEERKELRREMKWERKALKQHYREEKKAMRKDQKAIRRAEK